MIIIAEVGINHNGNVNLAHELIRQAKLAGADIVKFQFYDPDKLFGSKGSHPDEKAFRQAKAVELGFEEARRIKSWCDEEGIEFSASVFDHERFEWMEKLGVERYKIASRSVEDADLCEHILETGKETFIALGMWQGDQAPFMASNARYLYCVSKYPAEYSDLRLPESFKESTYDGFSDHTLGIEAALVAVGRGATIIEKHLTLNKGLEGPDHVCSMTPGELADLVSYSRRMEKVIRLSVK